MSEESKREVTKEEAEEWARKNGVLEYIETSAKRGDGVEMAFERVAQKIYLNIEAGKYDLTDRRSGVKGPPVRATKSNIDLGLTTKETASCC